MSSPALLQREFGSLSRELKSVQLLIQGQKKMLCLLQLYAFKLGDAAVYLVARHRTNALKALHKTPSPMQVKISSSVH